MRKINNLWLCALFVITFLVGSDPLQAEIEISAPKTEGELNELLSKLRSQALPQVKTIERCVRETNSVVSQYTSIRKAYMQKDRIAFPLIVNADAPASTSMDLNLYYNFDDLSQSHQFLFEKIKNFLEAEKNDVGPLSLEKINENIKFLNTRLEELNSTTYPIAEKETKFLKLLDVTKNELERLLIENRTIISWLISDSCKNAAVSWKLALLREDIDQLLQSVGFLKDYVVTLRERRSFLLRKLQIVAQMRLENRWREEYLAQGQSTIDSINGTMQTIKLGANLQEYLIMESSAGIGHGLHLRYLQYQEPLRVMLIQVGDLNRFEEGFLKIKDAPSDLVSTYRGSINTYRDLVYKSFTELKTKGWRAQRDRQILLNTKRLEKADGNCRETLESHLKIASSVEREEDFHLAEFAYKRSVDSCAR